MSHSVDHLTVVVLLRCFAEGPAARPELQDLQQQQAAEGGEALLQQEAVAQQAEELVHALQAHPLQLLPDAVQCQHQAVHLWHQGEKGLSHTLRTALLTSNHHT